MYGGSVNDTHTFNIYIDLLYFKSGEIFHPVGNGGDQVVSNGHNINSVGYDHMKIDDKLISAVK